MQLKDAKRMLDSMSPDFLRSKTMVRDIMYRDNYNVLADIDKCISEEIFGSGTPLRFLKGGDVIDGYATHIVTLQVAYDMQRFLKDCNDPDVLQCIDACKQLTVDNIYEKRDDWKAICKRYRHNNGEYDYDKQFLLTLFRSLYIVQDRKVTVPFIQDYLDEFGRDTPPEDCFELTPERKIVCLELADVISSQLRGRDYPVHIRTCSNAFSSMGHKKNQDWNYLINRIDEASVINSFAKTAILDCLYAIKEVYSLDDVQTLIDKVESIPGDSNSTYLIEFLPKGNTVSQNKGKVSRIIFSGNDILDLALDPVMKCAKMMKSHLPSCMSNSHAADVSNYTFAHEKGSQWRKGIKFKAGSQSITVTASMEGADSSNATERINGWYMWKTWQFIFDNLDTEVKLSFHLSDEYLERCKRILCTTPFWFYQKDRFVLSWTYGTAQGLEMSWDLLDFMTMTTIAEAYYKHFRTLIPAADRARSAIRALSFSGNMGDDGVYANIISSEFKQTLQAVSLPGVINLNKTEDEDQNGYAPFASAFVSSKPGSLPPILSNMRIISTLAKMSDPFSFETTQQDKYDRYQLRLVRKTLGYFRDTYNVTHRVMIDDDPALIADCIAFSYAERMIRYVALQEAIEMDMYKNNNLAIRQGTSCAPCKELAPSYRARHLYIENSSISSDRMYTILSYKQLESCYDDIDTNYMNEVDADLSQAAYLHFNCGASWDEITLDHYDKEFHQFINHAGANCSQHIYFSTEKITTYEMSFEGYLDPNMLIHVKLSEIRR